jgi:hypothetical protein
LKSLRKLGISIATAAPATTLSMRGINTHQQSSPRTDDLHKLTAISLEVVARSGAEFISLNFPRSVFS